jgi:Holliday junction resolvase RusA-like endonuclease
VRWCAREKRKRALEPALVRVHIPFTQNRRRDPHNYCGTVVKAIIDGLVKAGAWEDDTPEYVEHLSPVLYKGDEVKVEIYPMRSVFIPCEHGNFNHCPYGCKDATEITW